MRNLFISALLALALWMPASAAAQSVEDEARATIAAQLEAIRSDDWSSAYGYASPTIKRIFPSADAFRQMVVTAYPPVHRPRAYSFGASETDEQGRVVQRVLLTGPDGKEYEALYTLERQPDGSIKITGVSLRGAQSLGV